LGNKERIQEKYSVKFSGFGEPAPKTQEEIYKQFEDNLQVAMSVIYNDRELLDFIANRLIEIANTVPHDIETFELKGKNPFKDPVLYDYRNYPQDSLFCARDSCGK